MPQVWLVALQSSERTSLSAYAMHYSDLHNTHFITLIRSSIIFPCSLFWVYKGVNLLGLHCRY